MRIGEPFRRLSGLFSPAALVEKASASRPAPVKPEPADDDDEDVEMAPEPAAETQQASEDEDAAPKPKPRKKTQKKVVPVGRNGLKKKRTMKSRMTVDAKGYMGACRLAYVSVLPGAYVCDVQ